MSKLLQTKEDAEDFIFFAVTLQCEVLPKGQYALEQGSKPQHYCCLGIGVLCTIDEALLEKELRPDKVNDRILGGNPTFQAHTPLWLRNLNDHFKSKAYSLRKMNQNLIRLNDDTFTEWTHAQIGTLLLEMYADELNELLPNG